MADQIPASSSSAAAPRPAQKINRVILRYAQGNLTNWQQLDGILGRHNGYVYEVVFNYSVQFCQKDQGSKCKLKYLPGHYEVTSIEHNLLNGKLELNFRVTGTPEISFSGAGTAAQGFPLSKLYTSFTNVKLELDWRVLKPKVESIHAGRQVLSRI